MNDRLRIADADRESAARELGEHFALGRITVEEHAERLEQIWSARTAADLAPAFRDLPRPDASRGRPATAARRPRRVPSKAGRRPEMPHVPFLFKALLAIVVLWWGFHHLLFLLVAAVVYVVFVRRFVHRRSRPRAPGTVGPRSLPGRLALTMLLTWRYPRGGTSPAAEGAVLRGPGGEYSGRSPTSRAEKLPPRRDGSDADRAVHPDVADDHPDLLVEAQRAGAGVGRQALPQGAPGSRLGERVDQQRLGQTAVALVTAYGEHVDEGLHRRTGDHQDDGCAGDRARRGR